MRNECAFDCLDECFTSRYSPVREKPERSLGITYRPFTKYIFYYLFEISSLAIEKPIYYFFWYFEMTRIPIIPLPFAVLDIDNTDEPILFTFIVLVYSSFHPDIVISIRNFATSEHSAILRSCSKLFESRRHIWNSWWHSIIRESGMTCIWWGRKYMLHCSWFWLIGSTDSEVHREEYNLIDWDCNILLRKINPHERELCFQEIIIVW